LIRTRVRDAAVAYYDVLEAKGLLDMARQDVENLTNLEAANKKAADAFRISVEGQLASGIYRPDASKLTLKAACQGFLDHCEGRLRRDERMTRKMLIVYKGHISHPPR